MSREHCGVFVRRDAPRLGAIVPSTNTVVEPELHALVGDVANLYVTRVDLEVGARLDSEDGFAAVMAGTDRALPSAVDGLTPIAVQHVVFGTSARTFWGGVAGAREFEERLTGLVGQASVSTASGATQRALALCGVERVGVLTPYDFAVDHITAWLAETGYAVVATEILGMSVPSDMAVFDDRVVIAALHSLAGKGAEAILQVGTNMWFADLAGEATRWLGVPVLGVNTLLAWDAARRLGVSSEALLQRIHPALR